VIDGFSNFGSLILFMDPMIIKIGVLTQPEKQVFVYDSQLVSQQDYTLVSKKLDTQRSLDLIALP